MGDALCVRIYTIKVGDSDDDINFVKTSNDKRQEVVYLTKGCSCLRYTLSCGTMDKMEVSQKLRG